VYQPPILHNVELDVIGRELQMLYARTHGGRHPMLTRHADKYQAPNARDTIQQIIVETIHSITVRFQQNPEGKRRWRTIEKKYQH
jgi:hypothetical protein